MKMEQLSLYHSLGLRDPAVISFIGAGGKTTLLLRLASEMLGLQQKVLLTTTTKIFRPSKMPFFIFTDIKSAVSALKKHYRDHNIAVLGNRILPNGKIEGIKADAIEILRNELQVSVLVEADGAKGKPIKGYAEYEPVLPSDSDLIAAVIGADALEASISNATVHRLKYFLKTTGAEETQNITGELIAGTFQHMLKLGTYQAPRAATAFIFNKIDLVEAPEKVVINLARLLSVSEMSDRLLITQGNVDNPERFYLHTGKDTNRASVSCVILAAGRSLRMGEDKLALIFEGKTILEHVLDNVVKAGIEEIIVVTRPDHKWAWLPGKYKCRIVENPLYHTGMASSLQAGLKAVGHHVQGVLFALADQPKVTTDIYKLMVMNFQEKLKLITCPVFKGERGNPTLFDRRTWPDLMQLKGDQGGRQLINTLAPENIDFIETDLPVIIEDIDTISDYEALLDKGP